MDYRGKLRLYETCKYPRFSIFRCPCKINDAFFDCSIRMLDQEKLEPGESTEVEIDFMSIDVVAPLIEINKPYQVEFRPCGEILITSELWTKRWDRLEQQFSIGQEKKAVVNSVGWTTAGIVFDGIGIRLKSKDVGLKEWEEISKVLEKGDIVKIRIEKINRTYRNVIEVSFIEKVI